MLIYLYHIFPLPTIQNPKIITKLLYNQFYHNYKKLLIQLIFSTIDKFYIMLPYYITQYNRKSFVTLCCFYFQYILYHLATYTQAICISMHLTINGFLLQRSMPQMKKHQQYFQKHSRNISKSLAVKKYLLSSFSYGCWTYCQGNRFPFQGKVWWFFVVILELSWITEKQ